MENTDQYRGIVFEEGEVVLHRCRCGKGAHIFFWVMMGILGLLLIPSVWANVFVAIGIKEQSVTVNYGTLGATIPLLSVVVIAIVVLFFMRIVMLNHDYILTNRRVIVGTGRNLRSGRRVLYLDQIDGFSINQSLTLALFHLSSIDFYSPAASTRVRSFLIFSFAATPIKFSFLAKPDADKVFDLLQELVATRHKKP